MRRTPSQFLCKPAREVTWDRFISKSCQGASKNSTDSGQNVLQQVKEIPSTSTRNLTHTVRVSRFSVWRILREHNMHPFHVQCVQALQPDIYVLRIAFAQWYFRKCATDPLFPAKECSPMRQISQGKEFLTRLTQIWGRRTTRMLHDVLQHRLEFRSMFAPLL